MVVVSTQDPMHASEVVFIVLWTAFLLFVWGGVATILLSLSSSLDRAASMGGLWALTLTGIAMSWRYYHLRISLIGGILFATLLLSLLLWRWLGQAHSTHA